MSYISGNALSSGVKGNALDTGDGNADRKAPVHNIKAPLPDSQPSTSRRGKLKEEEIAVEDPNEKLYGASRVNGESDSCSPMLEERGAKRRLLNYVAPPSWDRHGIETKPGLTPPFGKFCDILNSFRPILRRFFVCITHYDYEFLS